MAVVEEEEVVEVVVVSFVFKSSSLLSFDVLFVAFGSSPSCGDRDDDVAVVVEVVVIVDVALVVLDDVALDVGEVVALVV